MYVGNNSLKSRRYSIFQNDEAKQAFADFKQAFRLSEANAFAAQEDYAAFQLSQTILKPALKLGTDISILLVGVVPVNVRKALDDNLAFELGDQGVSLEFVTISQRQIKIPTRLSSLFWEWWIKCLGK